jgi:formylglycine-generating enzyme required for sulfatase activity
VLLKAVQSLLVQTDGRRIYVLPAWPKGWDAEFKLHAPYNTTVTGKVERGRLVRLDVEPKSRRADVIVWPGDAKSSAITNSLDMRLVRIPAGEFLMGGQESAEHLVSSFAAYHRRADFFADEFPQHRVRITRPFYLGACEVTVGQFARFVHDTGYRTQAETDGTGGWGFNRATGMCEGRRPGYNWRNPGFTQTDAHPVLNVTWNDAHAFCRWLGQKEGCRYRLPTEAEWEYACRAETNTRYYCGDDPERLLQQANVLDAKERSVFPHVQEIVLPKDLQALTRPVGSYRPNPWGLYDMHGNVWEWCSDWHGEDYYAQSPVDDPQGPLGGTQRVRRGGGWNSFPLWARAAFRNVNTPVSRCVNLGFRVARDIPTP